MQLEDFLAIAILFDFSLFNFSLFDFSEDLLDGLSEASSDAALKVIAAITRISIMAEAVMRFMAMRFMAV